MKRIMLSTRICTELVAIFQVPPYQHLGLYSVSLYVFLWLAHQQLVMVLQITDLPSDQSSMFRALNEFGNFLKQYPHMAKFSSLSVLGFFHGLVVLSRPDILLTPCCKVSRVSLDGIYHQQRSNHRGLPFSSRMAVYSKIICWDKLFSFSSQPKQAYTNIIYFKHLPL